VGRGRRGAEHSRRMVPHYLPTVNRYSWGTSFETGTRSGRAERRKDPPAGVLSLGLGRPRKGMRLNGFVVGVEGGFKEEDGGNAARHFLDIADLVYRERATQEGRFA